MYTVIYSLLQRKAYSTTSSHRPGTRTGISYLGLIACYLTLLLSSRAQAQTSPTTFTYTGSSQTFTVPTGVTSLTVVAKGAKGAANTGTPTSNNRVGGKGGTVSAVLSVTPGQVLTLEVGGQGLTGPSAATGSYNGGGKLHADAFTPNGSASNGAGGGATDIRMEGTALANRVLIAGGGGGGAILSKGGDGGGLTGQDGATSGGGIGGVGGSQLAGGSGGNTQNPGASGVGGQGRSGGAGGGGYFGGGSGSPPIFQSASGGGGSSYTAPTLCTDVVHTQGDNDGDGSITLSWTETTADPCVFVPKDITVSGFTNSPSPNGVYVPDGTVNGAPRWKYGFGSETFYIQWVQTDNLWEIRKTNAFNDNQRLATNVAGSIANLPCTGWAGGTIPMAGFVGNPTLSGGCGPLGSSLTITPTPSLTIARGGSMTLTASGSSSYAWSTGESTTAITLSNVTSSTTISVTGTTGACSLTASAAVSVTAAPCAVTATVSGNLLICGSTATTLTASGAGAGGSYRWSTNETSAAIVVPYDQFLSVTVTTATTNVATTVRTLPTVSVVPSPGLEVCSGQSMTLAATANPGNNGGSRMATRTKVNSSEMDVTIGLSYTWSTGGSGSTTSFIPTATTVVSVQVGDGYCVSPVVNTTVTVQSQPTVSITPLPSLTIASGGSVTLTASGATSYTWSNGVQSASIVMTGLTSATTLSVTGTSGVCSATVSAAVSVTAPSGPAAPTLSASSSVICEGSTVSVVGSTTAEVSYQWFKDGPSGVPVSMGAGYQSATLTLGLVQPAQSGQYVLVVTSGGQSATSAAFSLTVLPQPTVTLIFFGSTQSVQGESLPVITLNAPLDSNNLPIFQVLGGAQYERLQQVDRINGFEIRKSQQSSSGVFTIDQLGPYSITVMGANGCQRTVTGVIQSGHY